MSDLLLYVDTSSVREGALADVREAMRTLTAFVDANESRILAYHVYFSADGTRMSVLHLHPDAASLEYHLDVGGPQFRTLSGLITLSSIDVYGRPGERVLRQLRDKARALGTGRVAVHDLDAGFSRIQPP